MWRNNSNRSSSTSLILIKMLVFFIHRRVLVASFQSSSFLLPTTQIRQTFINTKLFSTNNGGGGGRTSSAVSDKKLLDKTSSSSKKKNKKQDVLETQPVKGTRDFFPEEMRQRTWLFNHWRSVASTFGFYEYDCPILENESLYTRKAGDEVTQQLYNFEDKGGRRISLRPEMTPSLARMILSKKGGVPLPIKWYSLPQCWRYERMTRGRRREHYQWNMDIWGVQDVTAEGELLAAMVTFFENVGLTSDDVGIKVNSRIVISDILTDLGIPEDKFAATCVLIDKLDKIPLEAVQKDLEELGLSNDVIEKLTSILTPQNSLENLLSILPENSLAIPQLKELFAVCDAYGISDWIVFDASIIRGLSYYTGTVFEAFDRTGELRAIAGGGRYDTLLSTFGAKENIPATGFGFGDAVIVELLKERNLLPDFSKQTNMDVLVFAMNKDLYNVAISTAMTLRKDNKLNVDIVLESNKKTKWVFKSADRMCVSYVVIVAPDEYERGEVSVKNLVTGEQTCVKVEELVDWMSENIESGIIDE